MSLIPPAKQHTILEIWKGYEKRRKSFDSAGVPMSQSANECARAIWYQLHWASEPEHIDGQKQRRFDTGNIEEDRLLSDLEGAGFDVTRADPATGKQFAVSLASGWLRGKMDGIVRGLPEAPVTEHVVECKSHNDKSFKDLVKHGVAVSKPDHHLQCQLYMRSQNLERCLYLAVNKNDDAIYAERIAYDPAMTGKAEARIALIASSTKPPPKLHADPNARAAFACGWCQARPQCHEKQFARRNCRTCLSSEFLSGPVVRCVHWDKELSYDEQQAGCHAHRYIPALVPGEQIDANKAARTVTYKIDGAVWIDGESKPKGRSATVVQLRKSKGHCTYPDCRCAVAFPPGYKPSWATQCPRNKE